MDNIRQLRKEIQILILRYEWGTNRRFAIEFKYNLEKAHQWLGQCINVIQQKYNNEIHNDLVDWSNNLVKDYTAIKNGVKHLLEMLLKDLNMILNNDYFAFIMYDPERKLETVAGINAYTALMEAKFVLQKYILINE